MDKWNDQFAALIPSTGMVNVESLTNTLQELSKYARTFNVQQEYLQIRAVWTFIHEKLIPMIKKYVADNETTIKSNDTYMYNLQDALCYLLLVKMDCAIRYGKVEKGQLPIAGLALVKSNSISPSNGDYVKQIVLENGFNLDEKLAEMDKVSQMMFFNTKRNRIGLILTS